jgi:hypothetical protein
MPITLGINANVFRAISGSLFSSPVNWSRGYVPTGSDVADIRDNCTIDVSRTIGTLVVRPGFTASINTGLTLQINDTINVLGHLSCSGAPTVNVLSTKNNITSLSPGSSTFNFSKVGNQAVPGVTYNNVGIYYQGTKFAIGNIIVSGNINYFSADTSNTSSVFELNQYDLSVLGFTNITNRNHTLSKSKPGRILFTGQLGYGNPSRVLFTGNPTVEFRGGISGDADIVGAFLDSGVGTWIFSTNNQSIATAGRLINTDIYISGSITLTVPSGQILGITKILTGTSGSSVLANSGSLYFYTANPVNTFMTTGSANLSSSANTVGFVGNYDLTIPSRFANLWSLLISGTGTKTLGTSSYVSGAFTISAGNFNNSSYNITISGSTLVTNYGTWINTGSGTIKFIGPLRFATAFTDRGSMDFSVGNPNVEVQNGAYFNTGYGEYYQPGKGTWTFSTNNQNVFINGGAQTLEFNNLIVSGAISLCTTASTLGSATPGIIQISGSLNGTEANSKFVMGLNSFLYLNTLTPPMLTGSLDTSSYFHTLGYVYNGNQTVPYSSYKSLYISGNATKSLAQNTVISNDLHVDGFFPIYYTTKFDNKNYSLFVSGNTLISDTATLINTGGGPLTFAGSLRIGTAFTGGGFVDFRGGNPNVELRNGLLFNRGYNAIFYMGTGSYTFSTNNQMLYSFGGNTFAFQNIIVSGGINLAVSGSPGFGPTFLSVNGSINGTEANSKFTMGIDSVLYYNNLQRPMLTGSIDFSSSLNTFIYNSGSQDIRGGIYRNLTMLSGSKTLQGNVSVLNTLNTGSGAGLATVNLNGFTLTNP